MQDTEEYGRAVAQAATDRDHLARLVASGTAWRDDSAPSPLTRDIAARVLQRRRGMNTIRPKSKRRRR